VKGAGPAIECDAVSRRFGERLALDRLTLTVERGEILGLLGPNGSGKTTTVRILATLLQPHGGAARILSWDVARQPMEVRRSIGVMPERPSLYDRQTVEANVRFWAEAHELPDPGTAVARALAFAGVADRQADLVGSLSKGLKQRVALARAIVHRPPVLLLDEPSSGLDPSAAAAMESLVRDLAREGTAILLNTHRLAEAERLCDRVAILREGRLVQVGTPRQVRAALLGHIVEVELAGVVEAGPKDFVKRMPLGGENVGIGLHAVHTNIVNLERSFWTPQQGMHPVRAVYKHGMLPGRFEESHAEMAAWVMSEILELGVCPEVRYANPGDDNRWGHVMRWLDHAGERGARAAIAMRYEPARKYKVYDRNLRRDIIRMFVLDALGDNGDRHFGNWIVHDELRRAFAIDSGFMFKRESLPDRLKELMATRILLTLGAYSRDDCDEFRRLTSRVAERRDALVSAVMRIYSSPDSLHTTPEEVSRRLRSIERGLQKRIDLLIDAGWELPDIF